MVSPYRASPAASGIMVRPPRAPTECEVVLAREGQDGDGLEAGSRVAEGGTHEEARGALDGVTHRRIGRITAVNPGAFGAPLRGFGG
jgi:hypothetical protein